MRASCPNCSCAVWVAEGEVSGRTIDIKCPSCGHCFVVQGSDGLEDNQQTEAERFSPFFSAPLEPTNGMQEQTGSVQGSGKCYQVSGNFQPSKSMDEPSSSEAESISVDLRSLQEGDAEPVACPKQHVGISTIRAQSGYRVDGKDIGSMLAQSASTTQAETSSGDNISISSQAWKLLAALSSLAVLAMTCVTLVRYDIADLYAVFSSQAANKKNSNEGEAWSNLELPAVQYEDPDEIFKSSLATANQALIAKRFSRAALEFNRALSVRPGSLEALRGLAKAYHGLGDLERAALVEAQSAEKK